MTDDARLNDIKMVPPHLDKLPEARYANYVAIGHTIHEFTLFFGQSPGTVRNDELERAKETGEVEVRPVARIALPHTLLDPLIEILTARRAKIREEMEVLARAQEQS